MFLYLHSLYSCKSNNNSLAGNHSIELHCYPDINKNGGSNSSASLIKFEFQEKICQYKILPLPMNQQQRDFLKEEKSEISRKKKEVK